MKMLASVMERIQSLENISSAQPNVQPPQEQAPISPPQEAPQEDIQTPPMGEDTEEPSEETPIDEGGEDEGDGKENPFAKEDDTETDANDDSETDSEDETEDNSESPFDLDDDDGEGEDTKPEKNDEEDDDDLKSKVNKLNAKMDMLVGTDDDEDVVSKSDEMSETCTKCGKQAMSTETEAVSTKADEVETKTKETKVSTKSAEVGICECGKHEPKPIEEKETKPSMKSEENTLTAKDVTELLNKALALQKEEIYASLGVKSTETPITTVDAKNQPGGGRNDESGATLAEAVAFFSTKSGTPSMGELIGFIETKGGV
jgi:hypothetical protein